MPKVKQKGAKKARSAAETSSRKEYFAWQVPHEWPKESTLVWLPESKLRFFLNVVAPSRFYGKRHVVPLAEVMKTLLAYITKFKLIENGILFLDGGLNKVFELPMTFVHTLPHLLCLHLRLVKDGEDDPPFVPMRLSQKDMHDILLEVSLYGREPRKKFDYIWTREYGFVFNEKNFEDAGLPEVVKTMHGIVNRPYEYDSDDNDSECSYSEMDAGTGDSAFETDLCFRSERLEEVERDGDYLCCNDVDGVPFKRRSLYIIPNVLGLILRLVPREWFDPRGDTYVFTLGEIYQGLNLYINMRREFLERVPGILDLRNDLLSSAFRVPAIRCQDVMRYAKALIMGCINPYVPRNEAMCSKYYRYNDDGDETK